MSDLTPAVGHALIAVGLVWLAASIAGLIYLAVRRDHPPTPTATRIMPRVGGPR